MPMEDNLNGPSLVEVSHEYISSFDFDKYEPYQVGLCRPQLIFVFFVIDPKYSGKPLKYDEQYPRYLT